MVTDYAFAEFCKAMTDNNNKGTVPLAYYARAAVIIAIV